MTSQVRVGIVYFGSYPDIRVAKLALALADAGRSVTLLVRSNVLDDPQRAKHPYTRRLAAEHAAAGPRLAIRTVDAPGGLPEAVTMPYHLNPLWRRAITALVADTDVVIVRDIPLLLAASSAARGTSTKVVLDMAENYPAVLAEWRRWEGRRAAVKNSVLRNVHLARELERRAVLAADAVITVVEESAVRVRAMAHRGSVHVVENTPDLAVFDLARADPAPSFGPRRPLEIVHSGEVHVYRGIDTIIEAARLLRAHGEPSVRWHIVGTGKGATQLVEHAARAGVAEDVRFWGWQEKVMPFVDAADAGVVPPHDSAHYRTTMPNKLYEAMAASQPVIVSDVAPMRRVVDETGCGLTFTAGDPAALAQAAQRLLDPQQRARMGRNGRLAVERRYRWGVDATTLVELVDRLAAVDRVR